MSDRLTARIKSLAESLALRMTEMRRELHRFPELSGQETRTTATIRAWLKEEGIPEQRLDLPTGVVGIVTGASVAPVVAVRADIDALPVAEQTGLPFASEVDGVMHACGHDFHAAAVLGAGMILARIREEIPGCVKLFFQPAEEKVGGARQLIEAGAMDNPRVGAVIGGHSVPGLPAGHLGLKSGPVMASADHFRLVIEGIGGHAAMPQQTVDPIVAGAAVVSALQTAVSRNVSPMDPAVLSVGAFHAGTAPNVIPSEARIEGTIRAFDPGVRQRMWELLERIATGVGSGLGARVSIERLEGIQAVVNDPELTRLLSRSAVEIAGPEKVAEGTVVTVSEDFALYGERVPACFVWLGSGKAAGENHLWHHPCYDVAEEALPVAAAFFARAAVDCLRALARS